MGWGWVDRSARCWGIAGSKILVDLVSDCLQLTLLELADLDPAPALGRTDECGIHQLQNGPLAKGMRDHLGAPPFLAEQPLEQIGGADRPAYAPPRNAFSRATEASPGTYQGMNRHGIRTPFSGVIGIESGPRRRRVHSGFHGGHGRSKSELNICPSASRR